jgi:Cu/Ag efflux pump CusA
MINATIELSLRNKFLVLMATVLAIAVGVWALKTTPLSRTR